MRKVAALAVRNQQAGDKTPGQWQMQDWMISTWAVPDQSETAGTWGPWSLQSWVGTLSPRSGWNRLQQWTITSHWGINSLNIKKTEIMLWVFPSIVTTNSKISTQGHKRNRSENKKFSKLFLLGSASIKLVALTNFCPLWFSCVNPNCQLLYHEQLRTQHLLLPFDSGHVTFYCKGRLDTDFLGTPASRVLVRYEGFD